ncbi:MAG: hypothetical protein ACI4UB_03005 [Limosilactobacillus sp.]
MNKSFWKLWLRDQLPLLITYILLTDLVALLCYLYQLPMTIFTDLLRFSLPLLIVWLIATVLIAKRRQALLTVLEKCYLLVISLVAGLTTGVIFEKFAFLGLNRLLEIGKLH